MTKTVYDRRCSNQNTTTYFNPDNRLMIEKVSTFKWQQLIKKIDYQHKVSKVLTKTNRKHSLIWRKEYSSVELLQKLQNHNHQTYYGLIYCSLTVEVSKPQPPHACNKTPIKRTTKTLFRKRWKKLNTSKTHIKTNTKKLEIHKQIKILYPKWLQIQDLQNAKTIHPKPRPLITGTKPGLSLSLSL